MMTSFYVLGDLYNSLFVIPLTHPELKVDYVIWNQIINNLPDHYKLPDMEVVHELNRL
jgi:hypothetical protein